jgi:Flp pilus assembly protein TadD
VLQEQGRWRALRLAAAELVRRQPREPGGWVTWAFATRRSRSIIEAEQILLEAEVRHPREPTIQFNLGCYACLRGDLTEAKRRVRRAIALNSLFRAHATSDPDLDALRAALGGETLF